MIKLSSRTWLLLLLGAAAVGLTLAYQAAVADRPSEGMTAAELSRVTHVHGIGVDGADPSRLYLATHHGFFALAPDGTATRLSDTAADFMGFTPHPTEAGRFYASGHPAGGGNLGVIVSTDGGKTREQIAEGARGPVDFHAMDVSPADPDTLYGAYGGLQVSRDGGKSWEIAAPLPAGLIDLAASAEDADTLYAATEGGLLVSKDAGQAWQPAYWSRQPASLVEVTGDGTVYAFVVGTGLVRANEPKPNWTVVNKGFGDRVFLHFAADPTDADTLYVVTQHGEVCWRAGTADARGPRSVTAWRRTGGGGRTATDRPRPAAARAPAAAILAPEAAQPERRSPSRAAAAPGGGAVSGGTLRPRSGASCAGC